MQYIFNDRRAHIRTIEFRNTFPILNIEKITSFKEIGVTGSFVKKEFRYSFNDPNFIGVPWQPLTTEALTSINFLDNRQFYLHIRYTRSNVIAGNINSFILIYDSRIIPLPSPIDTSIINADLLQGENGKYYLNLYNHFGGLPIGTLDIQNIGNGAEVFQGIDYDPSITTIFLRSIVPKSGAVTITQENNRIVIGIDASFAGEVNIGENIGGGDVSIYVGQNLQNLVFRTLQGGTGIDLQYADSSTILIKVQEGKYIQESSLGSAFIWDSSGMLDVSVSGGIDGSIFASMVIYDPSNLDPSLSMPNSVGGISAGTTVSDLNGDTITAILNDLLFPTINPTFIAPSASFVMSPSITLYEVSTNIPNLTFTTSFSRGQILIGSTFQNFRSGIVNQYDFIGTGLIDISTNINPYTTPPINYHVQEGSQSWGVNVFYDQGPQPLDNKGNPQSTPLPAGFILASPQRIINGSYPFFATSINIDILTKEPLFVLTQNPYPSALSIMTGISLVAEVGGNKQKFDIPNPRLSLASLKGIRTLNTVSNQWEYQGGNAINSLLMWNTSQVIQNIQGFNILYTRYTYNGTDRANVIIKLEF